MQTSKYFSLLLLTTFLMGIAFPLGKLGMDYAPPFLLMAIRYLLAGSLLIPIVKMLGKPGPRGRKQWLQAAAIGLFQSAGVMGCAYYSMNWISSGESAILTCMNPLIVILLSSVISGVSYSARQWIGVVLGFGGVAVAFGLSMSLNPGTFICLAGAFCFALATMLTKRWGPAFDMTALAAYQMLFGGFILLVLSLCTEPISFRTTTASVSILLLLAILCSMIQFSLWYYLLKNSDAGKTSSFLFLVPLFGVLMSRLLLHEPVTWYVASGGALICFGIILVNRKSRALAYVARNNKASI
ncbi:EamA family transporter [Paenibacillus sp. HB172176]|uniref:DMT family transporter n=1 Tax=Paenibacillus sp. HB172176 TaxID=2493690 RepID=UPI00143BE552|nr:EamA family transporter [Paenibacillus sp. HB172176]